MNYKIRLKDMEFRAYHGCYDLEQKVGNRFVVDLLLDTSLIDFTEDNITEVINYLTVYEVVEAQMKVTQRTIEAVAHNIIEAIKLNFPMVEGVECEVAKLAPPLGGKIGRVSVVLKI